MRVEKDKLFWFNIELDFFVCSFQRKFGMNDENFSILAQEQFVLFGALCIHRSFLSLWCSEQILWCSTQAVEILMPSWSTVSNVPGREESCSLPGTSWAHQKNSCSLESCLSLWWSLWLCTSPLCHGQVPRFLNWQLLWPPGSSAVAPH